MSARFAAVPPALFHSPAGRAFHASLTETELNTVSLRVAIGQFVADVDSNGDWERSWKNLVEQVSTSNAGAHQALRDIRDELVGHGTEYFRGGGRTSGRTPRRRRKATASSHELCSAGAPADAHRGSTLPCRSASRARARRVRRGTTQVPDAAVAEGGAISEASKDSRSGGASETAPESMVQLQSDSRNVRRVRGGAKGSAKNARKSPKRTSANG